MVTKLIQGLFAGTTPTPDTGTGTGGSGGPGGLLGGGLPGMNMLQGILSAGSAAAEGRSAPADRG